MKGGSIPKKPSGSIARSSVPANVTPTILTRATNIVTNMRKLLEALAGNFKTRPMFLLQMLAFMVGFLIILSRRGTKDRIKRVLGSGWTKVRQTAGMGVKVSYI
jgi:hypothetical protein